MGMQTKARETGAAGKGRRGEAFERLYSFDDGWQHVAQKAEAS